MKAITINETGDFKKLTVDDIAIPEPSDNEVLVKIHAEKRLKTGTGKSREFRSNKLIPGIILLSYICLYQVPYLPTGYYP